VLLQEASTGFLNPGGPGHADRQPWSSASAVRGPSTTEREKQTWEAVLLTPPERQAKSSAARCGGVMGGQLLVPSSPTGPRRSTLGRCWGGPLALGPIRSFWLAASVLAMYFIGGCRACGPRCAPANLRGAASCHTLVVGYLGGLSIYTVTSPLIAVVAGILLLFIVLVGLGGRLQTSPWCACATGFEFLRRLRHRLEHRAGRHLPGSWPGCFWAGRKRWVARPRTAPGNWHDEPYYRRSRPGRSRALA